MNFDAESGQVFLDHLRELTDDALVDTPPELSPIILETSARGDEVTIIYKQAASAQVFGRRGGLRQLASLFSPEPSLDSLAKIVLRSMAEPHADDHGDEALATDYSIYGHIVWLAL